MNETFYKPLTPKLRNEIIESINNSIAELNTCEQMSNGEMEKDEAIELLCAYGVPLDEKKFQEALNMAIEALSAEYKHEAFGWCDGCKEYDTENHCCHRYSSFIRETLQDNIDAVLEDIKEEIKELNNQSMFFGYVSNPDLLNAVVEIIEKHISRKE